MKDIPSFRLEDLVLREKVSASRPSIGRSYVNERLSKYAKVYGDRNFCVPLFFGITCGCDSNTPPSCECEDDCGCYSDTTCPGIIYHGCDFISPTCEYND